MAVRERETERKHHWKSGRWHGWHITQPTRQIPWMSVRSFVLAPRTGRNAFLGGAYRNPVLTPFRSAPHQRSPGGPWGAHVNRVGKGVGSIHRPVRRPAPSIKKSASGCTRRVTSVRARGQRGRALDACTARRHHGEDHRRAVDALFVAVSNGLIPDRKASESLVLYAELAPAATRQTQEDRPC